MVLWMTWLWVVVAGALVSWWLTRKLAGRNAPLLLLDHPNERSLHVRPTPRTGGLAIMGTFFAGVLALGVVEWIRSSRGEATFLLGATEWWILATTFVLSAVSFMDDRRGLPVSLRLGIQFVVAVVLVVGSGLVIPSLNVPFVGAIRLEWMAIPISVALLVWMANLYNFMDGMDGFAGGMTLIGGLGLSVLAWEGGSLPVAFLSLLVAGAAAGFLACNFPPAKIFMGDVGSIPLGFLFGALSLLGCRNQLFDVWAPLLLFSPFVVDATVTLARRGLSGARIWEAHRTHYYQRVVLLGWGHRRTVLVEYGLMVLCAGLAWLYQVGTDSIRLLVLCVWCLVFAGLMLGVAMAERAVVQGRIAA
jgi:UDP-N-acetylmuramyl pentapeptide phosphotransferase/UDP-N-acetylglucosamine-1-phosphate transferase